MSERGNSIFKNRPYQKESAAQAKKRRTLTRHKCKKNTARQPAHSTCRIQIGVKCQFVEGIWYNMGNGWRYRFTGAVA